MGDTEVKAPRAPQPPAELVARVREVCPRRLGEAEKELGRPLDGPELESFAWKMSRAMLHSLADLDARRYDEGFEPRLDSMRGEMGEFCRFADRFSGEALAWRPIPETRGGFDSAMPPACPRCGTEMELMGKGCMRLAHCPECDAGFELVARSVGRTGFVDWRLAEWPGLRLLSDLGAKRDFLAAGDGEKSRARRALDEAMAEFFEGMQVVRAKEILLGRPFSPIECERFALNVLWAEFFIPEAFFDGLWFHMAAAGDEMPDGECIRGLARILPRDGDLDEAEAFAVDALALATAEARDCGECPSCGRPLDDAALVDSDGAATMGMAELPPGRLGVAICAGCGRQLGAVFEPDGLRVLEFPCCALFKWLWRGARHPKRIAALAAWAREERAGGEDAGAQAEAMWSRRRIPAPAEKPQAHAGRAKAEGKRGRKPRAVRNLDTGEVFPSAAEAAESVGRGPQSVMQACRRKAKCAGVRWEYID